MQNLTQGYTENDPIWQMAAPTALIKTTKTSGDRKTKKPGKLWKNAQTTETKKIYLSDNTHSCI